MMGPEPEEADPRWENVSYTQSNSAVMASLWYETSWLFDAKVNNMQ